MANLISVERTIAEQYFEVQNMGTVKLELMAHEAIVLLHILHNIGGFAGESRGIADDISNELESIGGITDELERIKRLKNSPLESYGSIEFEKKED